MTRRKYRLPVALRRYSAKSHIGAARPEKGVKLKITLLTSFQRRERPSHEKMCWKRTQYRGRRRLCMLNIRYDRCFRRCLFADGRNKSNTRSKFRTYAKRRNRTQQKMDSALGTISRFYCSSKKNCRHRGRGEGRAVRAQAFRREKHVFVWHCQSAAANRVTPVEFAPGRELLGSSAACRTRAFGCRVHFSRGSTKPA